MSALAAKQFSDFAYFDVHFQGFMGVREVYRILYYILPEINWHFVFQMITEGLCLLLLMRSIRKILLKNLPLLLIRIIQLAFVLIFIENLVFLSHTRVSIIFCGIALFNLAFKEELNRNDIFLNGLVFTLGMLLRSESAIGAMMIVGSGYLIFNINFIDFIKRFWSPILILLSFVTIFTIDLMTTDVFVKRVEPEIEYKMMAKRVVDIGEMKTAKDSVKYEAALVGMWFDMKEMSPEFMRSIIVPGSDMSFRHIKDVFIHVSEFYNYYIFLFYSIIAILFLSTIVLRNKLVIFKMVFFLAVTFLIIYALDYNGFLVSNRHFLSMQIISMIIFAYYFFSAERKKERVNSVLVLTAFVFVSIGIGQTISNYYRESVSVNDRVNQMRGTMKEFERRYQNRIVAITIDSRLVFDNRFSVFNENYIKNKYLMFDWFTFPLTPRYVSYLSRECGCDASNPKEIFNWLAKNNALYLSVPQRYELTTRYMKTVHGLAVKFTAPVEVNNLGKIDNYDTKDCQIRNVILEP